MKTKFACYKFYQVLSIENGCRYWQMHYINFIQHYERLCIPQIQYCGAGQIYINMSCEPVLNLNRFLTFSEKYDFQKPAPFVARRAR